MDGDDALLARLAADPDSAFADLVTAHQDRLFSIALRLLGDARDAEEVVQDAFVRAYRALHEYEPERVRELRLRPWLVAIAVNQARNRRRRLADLRPPASLTAAVATGFEPVDGARTPHEHAAAADEAAELGAALLALAPALRAPIVLRHVAGLSLAETAAALDRPEGTVKAQVHRGLARLRVLLAPADSWREAADATTPTIPRTDRGTHPATEVLS
jgi:RNA polymerase sigma-70 factor (ECF subfamily)